MEAGIDAVVVTDHDSGEWIDRLKLALSALATALGFRPLVVFPSSAFVRKRDTAPLEPRHQRDAGHPES